MSELNRNYLLASEDVRKTESLKRKGIESALGITVIGALVWLGVKTGDSFGTYSADNSEKAGAQVIMLGEQVETAAAEPTEEKFLTPKEYYREANPSFWEPYEPTQEPAEEKFLVPKEYYREMNPFLRNEYGVKSEATPTIEPGTYLQPNTVETPKP